MINLSDATSESINVYVEMLKGTEETISALIVTVSSKINSMAIVKTVYFSCQ